MKAFYVNWNSLQDSDLSSLMIRLSMVANDISTVFLLLDLTRDDSDELKALKKNCSHPLLRTVLNDNRLGLGFEIYGFRMLIGHFCEGMKIIFILKKQEEIGNQELLRHLRWLQPTATKDYEYLKLMWTPGSDEENQFKRLMQAVRHSVSFHYEIDDKYIKDTISKISETETGCTTSFIQGRDITTSRFCVADTVVLRAITDLMWKAVSDDDTDTTAKIGESIKWCSDQCRRLYTVGLALGVSYYSEQSV